MRTLVLAAAALLQATASSVAWADGHAVTVRNGGGETIHGIFFDGSGDSRLRHDLPQGAVARITFNTRCRTDVRIAYASGRTEDHPGVDACTDPQITAGQDGTAGPSMPPAARTTALGSQPKPGPKLITTVGPATPVKAPPPEVPPWTGKSITKRFGGMD